MRSTPVNKELLTGVLRSITSSIIERSSALAGEVFKRETDADVSIDCQAVMVATADIKADTLEIVEKMLSEKRRLRHWKHSSFDSAECLQNRFASNLTLVR